MIGRGETVDCSQPGVINLPELEKDQLLDLEAQTEKSSDLIALDYLRSLTFEGTPLDERHAGIRNMAPVKLLSSSSSPSSEEVDL